LGYFNQQDTSPGGLSLTTELLLAAGVLIASYLIGSIPFGLVVVKLATGRDLRNIESGRTGGTNAMRAAGFIAGAATVILDFFKGAVAVWLARAVLPGSVWLEVIAPVIAVLGHNYSIFLAARDPQGKLHLRGGAGGATTVGGAMGLWWLSALINIPVGVGILFGVGYASVATLSVGISSIAIFAYRAWIGASPWEYIMYGVLAEILLLIALRPNIKRLLNGTERVVGWRARRKSKIEQSSTEKKP
jgi:glycerol-3-phosphate acyltransferase PlsY